MQHLGELRPTHHSVFNVAIWKACLTVFLQTPRPLNKFISTLFDICHTWKICTNLIISWQVGGSSVTCYIDQRALVDCQTTNFWQDASLAIEWSCYHYLIRILWFPGNGNRPYAFSDIVRSWFAVTWVLVHRQEGCFSSSLKMIQFLQFQISLWKMRNLSHLRLSTIVVVSKNDACSILQSILWLFVTQNM